jgi:SPP1 gp7 family putative phage head morphogenesis protein
VSTTGRVSLEAADVPRLHGVSDPTGTTQLRESEFRPALTRRFDAIRQATRTTVGYENDALRLRQGARDDVLTADADDVEDTETFTFETDAALVDAFVAWLESQIAVGILERVPRPELRRGGHWSSSYIRSAADRGWTDAARRLQQRGIDVNADDLESTFDPGVPRSQLESLFTRTFDNVETITDRMRTDVRRELTTGLARGENPRKMAGRLTERIDVSRTDAERLARTEIIHSYNESSLSRYEQAGVSEVTGEVEFLTANDARVCPVCRGLSGSTYTIAEARGVIPGNTHPQCRCTWVPAVPGSTPK